MLCMPPCQIMNLTRSCVCVLLAWQYYTNPFAQTGANAFFTAAAADAGSLWGIRGLATIPATSAEKASAIHPARMGEKKGRSYETTQS